MHSKNWWLIFLNKISFYFICHVIKFLFLDYGTSNDELQYSRPNGNLNKQQADNDVKLFIQQ